MPVWLFALAFVVLAGPFAFGRVAADLGHRTARVLVVTLGCLFPPILWVMLWFSERMTAHGGDFHTYTDGDIGIVLAGYLSVFLLLVSTPSALITLAVRKGRQARRAGL